MPNFTDMLSKAKEMQEKMKEAQEMIKKIEVEGNRVRAAGGAPLAHVISAAVGAGLSGLLPDATGLLLTLPGIAKFLIGRIGFTFLA